MLSSFWILQNGFKCCVRNVYFCCRQTTDISSENVPVATQIQLSSNLQTHLTFFQRSDGNRPIVLNWPTLPSHRLETLGTRGLNLVPKDIMKCPLQAIYWPFFHKMHGQVIKDDKVSHLIMPRNASFTFTSPWQCACIAMVILKSSGSGFADWSKSGAWLWHHCLLWTRYGYRGGDGTPLRRDRVAIEMTQFARHPPSQSLPSSGDIHS